MQEVDQKFEHKLFTYTGIPMANKRFDVLRQFIARWAFRLSMLIFSILALVVLVMAVPHVKAEVRPMQSKTTAAERPVNWREGGVDLLRHADVKHQKR